MSMFLRNTALPDIKLVNLEKCGFQGSRKRGSRAQGATLSWFQILTPLFLPMLSSLSLSFSPAE